MNPSETLRGRSHGRALRSAIANTGGKLSAMAGARIVVWSNSCALIGTCGASSLGAAQPDTAMVKATPIAIRIREPSGATSPARRRVVNVLEARSKRRATAPPARIGRADRKAMARRDADNPVGRGRLPQCSAPLRRWRPAPRLEAVSQNITPGYGFVPSLRTASSAFGSRSSAFRMVGATCAVFTCSSITWRRIAGFETSSANVRIVERAAAVL
jgi:hypothetical protein